jgi:hypothetical protein
MLLHSRVIRGLLFNMLHKFSGYKKPPACLTALKFIDPDHFITNGNGPQITLILHPDGTGGADIGAGTAPDADPFYGNDKTVPPSIRQLEGTDTHNLLADPNAQTATDTAISQGAQRHSVSFRQIPDSFGLGCHGEQVLKSKASRFFNIFALCLYHETFSGLYDTGKQNFWFSRSIQHLNTAQFTGPNRLEGLMVTEGGNLNAVFPHHLQEGLAFNGFIWRAIDIDVEDFCHFFLIFECPDTILRKTKGSLSFQGHLYEGFRIIFDRIRVSDNTVKTHVTVHMRLPVVIL